MNDHNYTMLPNHTSIPLHCNICPKQPNFSDTSHLLTHIASKGHLSHYYKLKVKASTDPASKRSVDEYDEWYDEHRVEDLMMERMTQKEKKKSGLNAGGVNRNNSRRGSTANSAASTRSTPVVTEVVSRRSRAQREDTLDPQLGPRIKMEPKSRSGTPMSAPALDAALLNRSYAPPMQSYPATPYARSPMNQEASMDGSLYSTPTSDSGELESSASVSVRTGPGRLDATQSSFMMDDAEPGDGSKDTLKLKGVYWNGMGMFDSATPDMKRKRNQKKATSVLEQLQATSTVVEATEQVFDDQGELRRERPITGNPEEDDGMSPLKGESSPEPEFPPKKKGTRRPRVALAERNVNTGRTTRQRGNSHHPASTTRIKRTPYFDGDDDDDDLTYVRRRSKKNSGLSIHRDNSGPEITFEHSNPMVTLTSGFRNPLHANGLAHHVQSPRPSGMFGRGHQRQPSAPFGPGFKPSNNNPLSMAPPNFGSFGQLSGQTMFQGHHPFVLPNGHHSYATIQQQFTMGPPPHGNDNNGFHAPGHDQHHVGSYNPWDPFGFGHHDLGVQNDVDLNFHGAGEFGSMNPLFISSNQAGPEDDEATVSPPGSQACI